MHLQLKSATGIPVAVAAIAVMIASPAAGAVLGAFDFDSFGSGINRPSAPNVAPATAGVFVSSLDADAGAEGNSDGLGTVTANETRDTTPDVFDSMTLAIGIGTTARNPFANPPQPILASQDYLTFTLINSSPLLVLESFSFDYGASVRPGDSTGLLSAAQLFYSLNAQPFVAVGERQDRTVPSGTAGVFIGFTNSVIGLGAMPELTPGDSIEFRLAFGDNSGRPTEEKGVYIDNLVLRGAVVPEPLGLAWLVMAVPVLHRRRRSVDHR